MSDIVDSTNTTGKYPEAPTYKVRSVSDLPVTGLSVKIDPDTLGNRFNTVDIDLSNQEVVDALAEEYPDAWAAMYRDGSVYEYNTQNAYKLKRAVEYYKWLHAEEGATYNISEGDSWPLDPVTPDSTTHRVQVPYSEFMMSEKWSESRIPLDLQYSMDFQNDVSAISPAPHYYDARGLATEIVSVVLSATDDSGGLSRSYVYTDENGNSVTLFMHYLDNLGNIVPIQVPIYSPFLMQSARSVAAMNHQARLNRGANGFDEKEGTWIGFSEEYLSLRAHQVGHVKTRSPYDWGGEFAAGRRGFPN